MPAMILIYLAENAQFEEVIFLLWNYRLPNEEELAHLKGKLNQYMTLNPRVYTHFEEYVTSRASNDSITYVIIIYCTFRS